MDKIVSLPIAGGVALGILFVLALLMLFGKSASTTTPATTTTTTANTATA